MYVLHTMSVPAPFGENGKLHYVSSNYFERDWKGSRHSHDFSEIFFVINGLGTFQARNTTVSLRNGDFILVNPAVEHMEESSKKEPLEYVVLGFSGFLVQFPHLTEGFYHGSFQKDRYLFISILTALIKESEHQTPDNSALCSALTQVLFSYVKKYLTEKNRIMEPFSEFSSEIGDSNCHWVRQYIEDNFTKKINLDKLSNVVGLNKYTLLRNFKKTYGVTPLEYAHSLQLREAKFLLHTTGFSCKTIATLVGFDSANYFTQFFLTHEGVSPTNYRKNLKK